MIRFAFVIYLGFFGWTAFGEKAPEPNDISPLKKVRSKEMEAPDPLEKRGRSLMPRSAFRLKWAGAETGS